MARAGVALQLFTVREETKADMVAALRKVREAGYSAIEFGGVPSGRYGTIPAAELRRLMDEMGVRAISAHVGQRALEEELGWEVETNQALGNSNLVCDSLARELRADEAGFHEAARRLNEVGRRCKELGARLHYHSHAFEFQRFGDKTGIEILLGETDPGLLYWQPDVYWISHVGENPAAWIGRYADRAKLVHLKDMKAGEPVPDAAKAGVSDLRALRAEALGSGTIQLGPVFEAATGAEWYIVEQDFSEDRDVWESVRMSLRTLQKFELVPTGAATR